MLSMDSTCTLNDLLAALVNGDADEAIHDSFEANYPCAYNIDDDVAKISEDN